MRPAGLLVALVWLSTTSALAHVTSVGLASLDASDSGIAYRLLLAPDDLSVDLAAALMRAGEGDATIDARLTQVMQRAVPLRAGDQPCQPTRSGIAWLVEAKRLELRVTFQCAAGAALTRVEHWRELLGEPHHNI